MKIILRALLLSLAFLSPRLTAAPAANLPAPSEKRVYKEVEGRKLEIWIWKPAHWSAQDHRSAIVFYHGGAWRAGGPSAFSRQSARLAELGMIAFSVQYRLTSQPGVTIQDCVKDAKSAFRWVRSHAAEFGIDPRRIAAGGGSAGGHLAAALVTLDAIDDAQDDTKVSTTPAALVLFNPALRLSGLRAQDSTATRSPAAMAAISPYDHLKRGHPPTIILHGEADTTVPIQSVRDYAQRVEQLGGSCTVVGFPGQVHAFFNREPFVGETMKRAEAFLKQQKMLPQESG